MTFIFVYDIISKGDNMKALKRLIILLIVVALALAFLKYAIPVVFPKVESVSEETVTLNKTDESLFTLNRERLSDDELLLYESLLSRIASFETEFKLDTKDSEQAMKVYDAVIADHPEYYWLSYVSISAYQKGSSVIISPYISEDMDSVKANYAKLKALSDELLSETESMSDYEKALYFHNYLIDNTTYDSSSAYDVTAGGGVLERGQYMPSVNAYGALCLNKAICSGYACAYQMLLNMSGIPCSRVKGTGFENSGAVGHEWNILCLDGEWYYTDVTWDDPVADDGSEGHEYDYFCINDAELNKTHSINEGELIKPCSATGYNYFVYNGLYFESYSFESVRPVIENGISGGAVRLKFSSKEEADKALSDLIDNYKLWEIDGVSESVSYGVDSTGERLAIFFK